MVWVGRLLGITQARQCGVGVEGRGGGSRLNQARGGNRRRDK